MSVRYGFTVKMYGFRHSLRTCLAHAAHDAIAMEIEVEDSEEQVQMYGRRLTAQQRDERRQDNGDKKRLARQHSRYLLHSLTRATG